MTITITIYVLTILCITFKIDKLLAAVTGSENRLSCDCERASR